MSGGKLLGNVVYCLVREGWSAVTADGRRLSVVLPVERKSERDIQIQCLCSVDASPQPEGEQLGAWGVVLVLKRAFTDASGNLWVARQVMRFYDLWKFLVLHAVWHARGCEPFDEKRPDVSCRCILPKVAGMLDLGDLRLIEVIQRVGVEKTDVVGVFFPLHEKTFTFSIRIDEERMCWPGREGHAWRWLVATVETCTDSDSVGIVGRGWTPLHRPRVRLSELTPFRVYRLETSVSWGTDLVVESGSIQDWQAHIERENLGEVTALHRALRPNPCLVEGR